MDVEEKWAECDPPIDREVPVPDRPATSRCLLGAALLALPLLATAASAAARVEDRCNVPVVMSDGAVMRANVTLAGSGRRPTVMIATGYNKDNQKPPGQCSSFDPALTAAGFNVVVFDDRGTGSSDGTWGVWDSRTQLDYQQEVAWIAKQPWSNGKIGTAGTSYMAITSLLVAAAGGSRVQAVYANYPAADPYRDITYFGGALNTAFMPPWFGLTQADNTNAPTQLAQGEANRQVVLNAVNHAAGSPAATAVKTMGSGLLLDQRDGGLSSPYDNAQWRGMAVAEKANRIKAAVLYVGGWRDIFQRGQSALFPALSATPAGGKVWIEGGAYHAGAVPDWASLGYGRTEQATKVAWFEHWLKGADNVFAHPSAVAPVNAYDMSAHTWQKGTAWPLPGTRWQSSYLSTAASGASRSLVDGSLTSSPGTRTGSTALPFSPVGDLCSRSLVQQTFGTTAGIPCETDGSASEATELTFTTPVRRTPLHLAGPVTLDLRATITGATDTMFFAALTDVDAQGRSNLITTGALEAAHAALHDGRSWHDEKGQVVRPYHPFTADALQSEPSPVS